MIFIGIDPGQKGGISYIDENQENIVKSFPYSDDMLKTVLNEVKDKPCLCYVEKVGAMPKQGVVSTFKFGRSDGIILGMLMALQIPFEEITPQKWKKMFGLIGKDKKASIECAKHLFPYVSLMANARCRVPHDGMAESLLLAEASKRAYYGGLL